MWTSISEISIFAMVALCVAAGVFARNKSRLGRQLVFLFGTFVICPLFGFAMYQSVSQHLVDGFRNSNGFASFEVGMIALSTISALVIWLLGFWISSAIGWAGSRHKNVSRNIFSFGGWLSSGWEEMQFRKVPEGWIMSGFWPFARGNYLLNDEQKADAAEYFRSLGKPRVAFVVAILAIVGSTLLSAAPSPLNDPVWGQGIYFAAVILCLLIWVGFDYRRRLAPVLAGALRTTQPHYSYVERFKMNVTSMSFGFVIFIGLVSIAIFVHGIYSISTSSKSGWGFLFSLLETGFFGFWAMMWCAIAGMKWTANRPRSQ